jgi:hypothetical protein
MTEWREWTLNCGMLPPVTFIGELLISNDGVSGTSLWNSLVGGGRWHVISIFRTQEGRYVVYISYRSKVKGELENREVFWCDQPSELPTVLSQYQEVAMPVLAERLLIAPDKRQRAAMDILSRYQRQVSAVLAGLPDIKIKLS